jgi:hypothetical protein
MADRGLAELSLVGDIARGNAAAYMPGLDVLLAAGDYSPQSDSR